jgi:AraC-like DNA-binding protein
MNRLVFSTSTIPQQKRFSAYCDELFKWSCGLDLKPADQSIFQAELEIYRAGAIDIMCHTIGAIETSRTPELVKDGDDAFLVMLMLKGHADQMQLGQHAHLNPGDAIVCDAAYPGSFSMPADSRLATVKIPRMMLSALFPQASRLSGARLNRDPAAIRLLCAYLAGSFDIDLGNSLPAARLHQDHIINLVALALGTGSEAHDAVEQRGAQTVRRAALIREIATSTADPAFDASRAAGRLGITARYVHRLLEPTGKTFSEHLLDRRLASAVELLRDTPSFRKIADIALEVGFRDLSYFNRTFRRKYGGTPTDVRRSLLQLPHRRDRGTSDT